MDPREVIERNEEGLRAAAVKPYRDLLLRWVKAYGNVDRLDRDRYEAELFRVWLASVSALHIEPDPPHLPGAG